MVNGFLKFVSFFFTRSIGADEGIKYLEELSNIFGFPARFVTFTSGVHEAYQIERVKRVLLSIISKLSADNTTELYIHVQLNLLNLMYIFVDEVQNAIKAHVHSTTQKASFELTNNIHICFTYPADRINII